MDLLWHHLFFQVSHDCLFYIMVPVLKLNFNLVFKTTQVFSFFLHSLSLLKKSKNLKDKFVFVN